MVSSCPRYLRIHGRKSSWTGFDPKKVSANSMSHLVDGAPPNKALQLTANPLRGLSAAELGR
jgi:hypothetical protein